MDRKISKLSILSENFKFSPKTCPQDSWTKFAKATPKTINTQMIVMTLVGHSSWLPKCLVAAKMSGVHEQIFSSLLTNLADNFVDKQDLFHLTCMLSLALMFHAHFHASTSHFCPIVFCCKIFISSDQHTPACAQNKHPCTQHNPPRAQHESD